MNIKINTYSPGTEFDHYFNVTVDGVEYDVHLDTDKRRRSEISDAEGEPATLSEVDTDAILDRCELFRTFFDDKELADQIEWLTAEARGAMEQHLAQLANDPSMRDDHDADPS